jgi:hypothetical protein
MRQSEAARAFLGSEAAALRRKLDVPARLRGSLMSHPGGWMLGSLVSGLAASLLLRRRPAAARPKKRRGLPAALLGLGLTAARPLLKAWLANQLQVRLGGTARPGQFATRRPAPPPSSQAH